MPVGAGLSKDAGLPTAWDLMLSTAALILAGEDADNREDLQAWFLSSRYKNMTYAELIGDLFSTSVEQQNFIRDRLRANEPGKAHLLVAELARLKVLRCVITTNFDDLIEKVLGKVGLSVQVISNDDDLKHSEPLIHCKSFRVYKPHGSIGVGRLRNTPADVQKLSTRMENELVRVLRDHGLIVLGYSGNDEGILRVFRRRKQRFYPTFWVNPSEPPESIPLLFQSDASGLTYVPCRRGGFPRGSARDIPQTCGSLPASGLTASVVSTTDSIRNGRPEATAAVRSFMIELLAELKGNTLRLLRRRRTGRSSRRRTGKSQGTMLRIRYRGIRHRRDQLPRGGKSSCTNPSEAYSVSIGRTRTGANGTFGTTSLISLNSSDTSYLRGSLHR